MVTFMGRKLTKVEEAEFNLIEAIVRDSPEKLEQLKEIIKIKKEAKEAKKAKKASESSDENPSPRAIGFLAND
jgi:hypothetical protein